MNRATVQILAEFILSQEAKRILLGLGAEGMLLLQLSRKMAPNGEKLLDDFTEAVTEELAPRLNLMRWAMASADVSRNDQETIIARAARRIASLMLDMLDKVTRGEAIDDEHAWSMEMTKRLSEAKTQAERLRVLADALERDDKPAAVKFTAKASSGLN